MTTLPRRPRWPRTVRARTTLAATAVVAVALGVAFIGILMLMSNRLVASQRATAVMRAQDVAALAQSGRLPPSLSFPGEDTGVAQVVDPTGAVVASTANLEGEAALTGDRPEPGRMRSRIVGGLPIADDSRFVLVSLGSSTPSGSVTVYTAASLEETDKTLVMLAVAMAAGYALLLVVVAFSARYAVGRGLAPVEAIRAQVALISEQDLHRRVPEPGSGDEIDRLAATMNTMLEHLESSSGRQRRFVADASHELRSPLASLRTVLEVAAAHPETATLQSTVEDAMADTDRLEALVADLLTLARLDDPDDAARLRDVDLAEICRGRRLRDDGVRADRPNVELDCPPHAWITADPLVVERAVTNLVENAQRHAISRVRVLVEDGAGHWCLHVDDDGAGVAPEDRAHIFERFARLDDARSRDEGGTGLGLAIVADLARSLGGNVGVSTSPLGGARFTVTIPAASAPDEGELPG